MLVETLNILSKNSINIQVLGLLLDIFGAYFIVHSFIIKKPADIKSEAYGNANPNLRIASGMSDHLFFSLYKQGEEAKIGLFLLVLGFVLQVLGVLYPILVSFFIVTLILSITVISSIFVHRFLTNPNRIDLMRNRDERKFDKRFKDQQTHKI